MADNSGTWTVRRLLEWTPTFLANKGVDQPRLSAELLLSHVLHVPRIKLYTDYDRVLDDRLLGGFRELVRRAAAEEPIAYLTGRAHFFSLEFEVDRNVLIPRPDTETLVEEVLQTVRNVPGLETPRMLDLCTGSGCVAAAVAKNLKSATVLAIDLSEPAVAIAQRNMQKLGVGDRVVVQQGDLYEPLTQRVDGAPFDLIVSNPPYIPTDQLASLDRSVIDYEPRLALDGGPDGLALHRRILEGATRHLLPGGRMFLEIAFDQADAARELVANSPLWAEAKIVKDQAGHNRVLALRRSD